MRGDVPSSREPAMRADRTWIGCESPPIAFEVERGAICRFAEAIGESEPAYLSGEMAPPTFPTTLRIPVPAPIPLAVENILHGDEEYVYERPLRPGDRIVVRRRIVDVSEREGKQGVITLISLVNEACDEAGKCVYRAFSTIIQRTSK
jgi:hypothetical protein